MDPLIIFEKVEKTYGQVVALDEVDIEIKKGEFVVLIGPSGCGKTTFLKLINGLVHPTRGQIIVNNKRISDWDLIQLRRKMGYVIQQIGLFPYMNIAENISYVLKITGKTTAEQFKRAEELIELVEMDTSILYKYPQQLSGGQQQRIGVARALAADPDIILMDEPFGAIDQITRGVLQDEFLKLQKKLNKTIVFVTHDIQEAIKLGSKIAFLKDGKLIQFDTPKNMILNPSNAVVSEIFKSQDFMNLLEYINVEEVINKRFPKMIKGMIELEEVLFESDNKIPMVDRQNRWIGIWDKKRKKEEEGVKIYNDTPIKQALEDMMSHGVDWISVVSREEQLIGIIRFSEIYKKMEPVMSS